MKTNNTKNNNNNTNIPQIKGVTTVGFIALKEDKPPALTGKEVKIYKTPKGAKNKIETLAADQEAKLVAEEAAWREKWQGEVDAILRRCAQYAAELKRAALFESKQAQIEKTHKTLAGDVEKRRQNKLKHFKF